MKHQEKGKRISIFEGGFLEASLLKNLLERHGIAVFLENQSMGCIAPWQVTAGGINPVKLIISSIDQEQAARLIAKFDEAVTTNYANGDEKS
jgi:hypothetical protein